MTATRHPDTRPHLDRRLLATIVAIGAGLALLTAARIVTIRAVFHVLRGLAQEPAPLTEMLYPALILVGIGVVTGLLRWRERHASDRLGYEYVHAWRLLAYQRLQSVAPAELQRRGRGASFLRFVGDLSALRSWVSLGIAKGVAALAIVIGAVATIAVLDLPIAITLTGVVALAAALAPRVGRPIRPQAHHVRRRRARLANRIADHLAHVGVIQAYGRDRGERRRIERASRALTDELDIMSRLRGRVRGAAEAMAALAAAAVAFVGAHEVAAGKTTPGTVVAAVLITRQLTSSFRRLFQIQDYRMRATVSRQRLETFLEGAPRPRTSPARPLHAAPAHVELTGVSAPGRLEGVDAEVQPGMHVAILGANGAGKTSLLLAMAGLLHPERGTVRIDGERAAHSRRACRRLGLVTDSVPLLRERLERNLRYRHRAAPESEVAAVIHALDLEPTIERLAHGRRTMLHHAGANLSSGECRRIEIARAILGRPNLLLLDQPFQTLDPAGRAALRRILRKTQATVIWTATECRDAAEADAVWRIKDGRLVGIEPADAHQAPCAETG